MSNTLAWTRVTEPTPARLSPLEDYQRHVGIAQQVLNLTDALSQIAPGEETRHFTTEALATSQGDDMRYCLVGCEVDGRRAYDLKVLNKANRAILAPSVARLVLPTFLPDLSTERLAQDMSTINNWDVLSREQAGKTTEGNVSTSESIFFSWQHTEEPVGKADHDDTSTEGPLLFPRLAYEMPLILLKGNTSPYRTVKVEGHGAMGSFNVQVIDNNNLRRRANVEESLAVMKEMEALWPSLVSPEESTIDALRLKFPDVDLLVLQEIPDIEGLEPELQHAGASATEVLNWAIENRLQAESMLPKDQRHTYGALLTESSPGCVSRFVLYRTS